MTTIPECLSLPNRSIKEVESLGDFCLQAESGQNTMLYTLPTVKGWVSQFWWVFLVLGAIVGFSIIGCTFQGLRWYRRITHRHERAQRDKRVDGMLRIVSSAYRVHSDHSRSQSECRSESEGTTGRRRRRRRPASRKRSASMSRSASQSSRATQSRRSSVASSSAHCRPQSPPSKPPPSRRPSHMPQQNFTAAGPPRTASQGGGRCALSRPQSHKPPSQPPTRAQSMQRQLSQRPAQPQRYPQAEPYQGGYYTAPPPHQQQQQQGSYFAVPQSQPPHAQPPQQNGGVSLGQQHQAFASRPSDDETLLFDVDWSD